ncbi:MAG: phosphate acyltransferase PlsX [Desulfobulbus sp.]|nr:phosphate acyltransferase PlsX [Desulfobulbaceae bacterium]
MKIALDAMGGDSGPDVAVHGALAAVRTLDGLKVILVGPEELLHERLKALAKGDAAALARVFVHPASEIITMQDVPVDAIRRKKDATVVVGFDLVKTGKADAVVSAGNSGASMAAAVKKLGRLPGISRPGIASFFPTLKKPVMVMDIGANVDCRAQHLFQFAIMACSCSSLLLQHKQPRVGLLSIGKETGKGNALVKETYPLLQNSPLNFIGNVEGRDVYRGDVDVVVCDGFIGNILLKTSEGLADAALMMIRDELLKSWRAKLGYLLMRGALSRFKKKVDYAEYGGAPLLGINGTGIICHGSSDANALRNAIAVAADMAHHNINAAIVRHLSESAAEQVSIA